MLLAILMIVDNLRQVFEDVINVLCVTASAENYIFLSLINNCLAILTNFSIKIE